MLMQRKILLPRPITQIYLSPLQTYIGLQAQGIMVYRQDTLELIHQHEEQGHIIFLSFDESEQYMLVNTVNYYVAKHSRITIYRTSDFKVIKEIQLKFQLKAAYFQNEGQLILFNDRKKMVQSFDIKSEDTLDILRYDNTVVCPSIKQVDLLKKIRKFNPHFIYKSMNLQKHLIVLQCHDKLYRDILIFKLIKYDEGNNNKIIKTNRVFSGCREDQYYFLFSLIICYNVQFKMLYKRQTTQLIKGNKVVRAFQRTNFMSCITIEYPMKRIMIPQTYSIQFL